MASRRTALLASLALVVFVGSIPLGASIVPVEDGASVLAADNRSRPRLPPRARPPKPPRSPRARPPRVGARRTRGGGSAGGGDYRRGRGNKGKKNDKKKEENRWHVVQLGRDFEVARKKGLAALRKKAAERHARAVKSYKKTKKVARKPAGPRPAPVVFKVLTPRGFSTEKKAEQYRDRVAAKAKELLHKKDGGNADRQTRRGRPSGRKDPDRTRSPEQRGTGKQRGKNKQRGKDKQRGGK